VRRACVPCSKVRTDAVSRGNDPSLIMGLFDALVPGSSVPRECFVTCM
jgi:hypothetical protein